jgi:putative ABC transport system permease protein
MRALDRKLLRNLGQMRLQAAAIAAVIACGVAIAIMSAGAMASLRSTRDAYYAQNRFADVFSHLKRAPRLLTGELARLPGVGAWDVRITRYASLDIPVLHRPAAAWLISLPDQGHQRLNRMVLRSGRLPQRGRDELVMSEAMAKALGYATGDQLGVVLGGHKRRFTVVGVALSPEFVYVLPPGQLMPDDRAFGILWLDQALMEAAFDLRGAFNDVSLALAPGAGERDVIRRVDALLAPYGGTAAYGRADQTSHAFIDQELGQLRTIALIIPPVFLAVSSFLLHMVLVRRIDTERSSIGLLKSFGYTDREVGLHYMKLALLVTALGLAAGYALGMALGHWMTGMYQQYFHFPFLAYRSDPLIFALAGLVSLAAAMAGTWSAVGRAARLAPAAAMQPPAPAVYRRTLVDRMRLGRRLSMPGRMIARHLQRFPLRAALTTLGTAMAVMLLVSLFFFFDAIDALADDFYFRAQRQDVVVGLADLQGEAARYEAARWPGIRQAEPFLDVPARLSSGPLTQRLALTGIEPSSHFRTFHDIAGAAFTVPAQGVVLSDKLAHLLDVRRGDRIYVQVLEGTRREGWLTVDGIAAEHVGLSAYMDRHALAALTGQSGVVSSIGALVDPRQQDALFRYLKEVPTVVSVATREQAIAQLREVMAGGMVITINFYISLGVVIALGVIYNALRIVLSERAHELASLRVLGFTRAEVNHVLLGEVAILVALALPLGCAMGYGLAAGMARAMDTKLFRVPFVIEPSTYGIAVGIVAGAAVLCGAWAARRVNRLDLVAVLKTRE